jgi:hypothetical protein
MSRVLRVFGARRLLSIAAAAGLSSALVAAGGGPAWAGTWAGFSWESGGVQGWAVDWSGPAVSTSTTVHYVGKRSLKLPQNGEQYAGYHSPPNLRGIGVGSVVTFRVYLPSNANHPVEAKGYVTDGNRGVYKERFGPFVVLKRGAWNTIKLTIPRVTSIVYIGLEVDNPGWKGAVYLDGVSWTAPPRR